MNEAAIKAPLGFPLPKREREALDRFLGGPAQRPKGVGGGTLHNLINRRWIVRTDREADFGPELYVVTREGRLAIEFDTIAIQSGLKRPSPDERAAGALAYKDLQVKLEEFKEFIT